LSWATDLLTVGSEWALALIVVIAIGMLVTIGAIAVKGLGD
jgi:hypothetical protein